MKSKTIKEKTDSKEYTEYAFKEMGLIKRKLGINPNCVMFFLGTRFHKDYFLYEEIVYVANVSLGYDPNTHEPLYDTMDIEELYKIRLLKEYPKTINDIAFEVIVMRDPRFTYTPDEFLNWIDTPSDITEEIDNPYYEIIKFLNSYSIEIFKTDRYLFYSKPDKDYSFINNIYAYDTKNQAEMKLYIPNTWNDKEQKYVSPSELQDITAEDLSEKLSVYQQRQCKKAFLKLVNEENSYFKTKNYWVMELVKQVIQPVNILHEWSCHRCFCKPRLFGHIWVYDFPKPDEEPSFMIADELFTKVAVLKFKKSEYLFKGIYKRDLVKTKKWELSKQEIKELMYFLNLPCNKNENVESGTIYEGYKKYVKTNWQQLIFEYNHNTAGWGWGDTDFNIPPEKDTNKIGNIEALPFDLPMPDYTKILNDKR